MKEFEVELQSSARDILLIAGGGYELSSIEDRFVISGPLGPVTWGDLDYYERLAPEIRTLTSASRVIEIGPGLSEFLPSLSRLTDQPPIAIEPVDYMQIIRMLERAKVLGMPNTQAELADTLIQRAMIIQSDSVRLIRQPLAEAAESHPDLRNSADLVIDIGGAFFYQKDKQRVVQLEQSFLKPDGILSGTVKAGTLAFRP